VANNAKIALILAALAAFMNFRDGGGGGGGDTPGTTKAIAAQVHRDRAARQAAVYLDVAKRIESGDLADAPAAGNEVVKRIAAIETDVAKPLGDDAAKNLPAEAWDDKAKAAKWFRDAAAGFEVIAK
jgi:hypothetical protein